MTVAQRGKDLGVT